MGSSFLKVSEILIAVATSLNSGLSAERTVDELVAQARTQKLEETAQWKNLLHYQPGLLWGISSQADGREFFLSPDGDDNPGAELEATLRSFFRAPTAAELEKPPVLTDEQIRARLKESEDSKTNPNIAEAKKRELLEELPAQHPICRFPARLRFLKKELKWEGEGLPKVECYRLNEFRRRLDAKSASLVFSSFYLNKPASAFGHSFLRINSGLWSQYGNYRNELLDTGINYAANATVSNPALYTLFGMTGFFRGLFTAVPYYYKVREYNDFESRDLWSYDLALTEFEVKMLVDHIWEQGSTYYDYFYFTENCSYHMFSLLDAAAPRFGLVDRLPFYVIPSDTVRVLYRTPEIVSKISYRASVFSQFRYRLKNMTQPELASLEKVMKASDPEVIDPALSPDSVVRVLDAFSDEIEFSRPNELITDGSSAQKLKQKILVKRAALGIRSPALDIPAPNRDAPHLAHGIRRISLGYAVEKGEGSSQVFGYKFAMHELLDPGIGYPRNMQIDFGQARFRYRNRPEGFRSKFEIDELNLFKIAALTPWNKFYSSKSVWADFGWRKAIDPDCESHDHRCLPLTLDFAPGLSVDPNGKGAITLFGFLQTRTTYTTNYEGPDFRFGAGPRLGALVHFSDDLRFMATSEVIARLFAEQPITFSSTATLRYGFAGGWAVDIAGKQEREWREAMAQLHFYY